MEKDVHLFEIFKLIIYFNFLELGKVKFGSIKVWKYLNIFEPFEFLKRFKPFWPSAARDCSRSPLVSPCLSPIWRHPHAHHPRASRSGRCWPPVAYRSGQGPPPTSSPCGTVPSWPPLPPHRTATLVEEGCLVVSTPFLFPPILSPFVLVSTSSDRSAAAAVGVRATAVSSPLWWAHPSGRYHPRCRPPEHSHCHDAVTAASSSLPHRCQHDRVSPTPPQLAWCSLLAPRMLPSPPRWHLHAWATADSRAAARAPCTVTTPRACAAQRFGSGRLGRFGRWAKPSVDGRGPQCGPALCAGFLTFHFHL
jgi:hypothetical protein